MAFDVGLLGPETVCARDSLAAGSCRVQEGGCRQMLVLSRMEMTGCWRNDT